MNQWDSEPAPTHQTLRELVNRVAPGDVETGIVLLERGRKRGRFCSDGVNVNEIFNLVYRAGLIGTEK